jgi:hypothetical protein
METILTPDILYACIGIFIVPMSCVLLGIMIAHSRSVISNEELKLEKEILYKEVREALAKRGIYYKDDNEPEIQWDHVDGPLIHITTGEPVWLSCWDRFLLSMKFTSIDKLNFKYCKKSLAEPHIHPTAY